MEDPLITYLNDHLSGARFAISLLKDLGSQSNDTELAKFSSNLLFEIEEDQTALSECVSTLGGGSNLLKEATAWVTQKVGKVKLSVDDALGQFEAIEMLMLGVSGKLALWDAISEIRRADLPMTDLELGELHRRALDQRSRLETLRLQLAKRALVHPDAF